LSSTIVALPAGWRLDPRAVVGSTNDEAGVLAAAGAPHGTVLWAESQEAGRGRRGRRWSSPPGNLYCSVLLRPGGSIAAAGQATFAAALAVADALEPLLPIGVLGLKWPNDVLVSGRKVSGILLESAGTATGGLDWLIIGTGINIRHHPADAPYPTTALGEWRDPAPDCPAVLGAYLLALDGWLQRWQLEGFAPLRAAWLARAHGLGKPISVRLDNQVVDCWFETLDQDGALILANADGAPRRVAAGDVFFGDG
jgi:BirA family transcriptional regulator, biotin operon repressor / biotin---[acetyl-CoA-carboxylase] ligase